MDEWNARAAFGGHRHSSGSETLLSTEGQFVISIVLVEPEIPPNTGNIIRLCANMGAGLHLIEPMAFQMEDKMLRRAGLDYHEYAEVKVWKDWRTFQTQYSGRLLSLSTRHSQSYTDFIFQENDALVFGSETKGLPDGVRASIEEENRLTIPMRAESRSLNLSNSVAIVAFEAWRQLDFLGSVK